AGARALGKVDRVLRERLALRFVGLSLHALTPTYFLDALLESRLRDARLLEEAPDVALVARRGQQEELGGDVLVATLLGFLVGDVEQVRQIAAHQDLARLALHYRQARDGGGQVFFQNAGVAACLADQA